MALPLLFETVGPHPSAAQNGSALRGVRRVPIAETASPRFPAADGVIAGCKSTIGDGALKTPLEDSVQVKFVEGRDWLDAITTSQEQLSPWRTSS